MPPPPPGTPAADASGRLCPRCQAALPSVLATLGAGGPPPSPDSTALRGRSRPASSPPVSPPPRWQPSPGERLGLRLGFWLLLLGGPFAAFLLKQPWPALACIAVGAVGAAFCLTLLHARPRTRLNATLITVAYSAVLIVLYAVVGVAVVFVGCLKAFKNV